MNLCAAVFLTFATWRLNEKYPDPDKNILSQRRKGAKLEEVEDESLSESSSELRALASWREIIRIRLRIILSQRRKGAKL
jgi:hypothetical protein